MSRIQIRGRERRLLSIGVATAAALLLVPSAASAVTRFAAPGGTAADTVCVTESAAPCNITTAAAGPDVAPTDEAVIEPGHYSDTAGDVTSPGSSFGVHPVARSVHGEVGVPRPVITLNTDLGFGAFFVTAGLTVSHVEVDTSVARNGISLGGGTLADAIVRASDASALACNAFASDPVILRDTVCLASGSGSTALGSNVGTFAANHSVTLRNDTAVSTGGSSFGLGFRVTGQAPNTIFNVDAKSVIARGTAADVLAAGRASNPANPNTGAHTTITLDHSNYATTQTLTDAGGGTAAVTPAGTGTNQMAAPILAADGYHQLAGSPTIEAGATDGSSGATDIDGQNRTIGQLPDIGADEFAFPTATAISCMPSRLTLGAGGTTCTVTVTDITSPPPVTFRSGVRVKSDGPGELVSACEEIGMVGPTQASCFFTYAPAAAGMHRLTATYPGDSTHDSSSATDVLEVAAPGAGMGTPPTGPTRHAKRCKKRKHRRAEAAKKRCKKKRR